MRSKRSLFERFPLDGHVTVAGEELTTPYHVYDGTLLFFGGTVDGSLARELLLQEELVPLLDEGGRALAAVWVCDFFDANLGGHHELQFSLFAASRRMPPLKAHPFAILRALTTVPEVKMVIHGLWNSTQRVVRYNCEHLRLDAKFASSEIEQRDGLWSFHFQDETGSSIAKGEAGVTRGQPSGVLWEISRHVGAKGMLKLISSPYLHTHVVNTRNAFASESLMCHTYLCSDKRTIRRFGSQDSLVIHHPTYASLDFKPQFFQQDTGVGFVFLRPQLWRNETADTEARGA